MTVWQALLLPMGSAWAWACKRQLPAPAAACELTNGRDLGLAQNAQ